MAVISSEVGLQISKLFDNQTAVQVIFKAKKNNNRFAVENKNTMSEITYNNMEEYCRTCLGFFGSNYQVDVLASDRKRKKAPNVDKINIHDCDAQTKSFLYVVLNIDVEEEQQRFPKCMCRVCYERLQDLKELKNKAIKSTESLYDIVKEHKEMLSLGKDNTNEILLTKPGNLADKANTEDHNNGQMQIAIKPESIYNEGELELDNHMYRTNIDIAAALKIEFDNECDKSVDQFEQDSNYEGGDETIQSESHSETLGYADLSSALSCFYKPKKKREPRKEHKWIDVEAKKLRNAGLEGTGRKGKLIQARTMRGGCNDKCRFRCHKKISDDERQKAFTQFWNLGDHSTQWQCLNNWTHSKDTPKSVKNTLKKKKVFDHTFTLPKGNGCVKVCKTMFLDTLDISYQWIRTADQKNKILKGNSSVNWDQRGKHLNRYCKVSEDLKKAAREHISSFPVQESSSENCSKKYLDADLNVSKMYAMFEEAMKKSGVTSFVTFRMYYQIFNSEFKYGFVKKQKIS